MLLLASAPSNHRRFPRRFTRSRIEVETHNSQAPCFLSILSVASAPTGTLLQVTHDVLLWYQRKHQRDLLPRKLSIKMMQSRIAASAARSLLEVVGDYVLCLMQRQLA